MGLDISHNTWHGAYSAFMRWREEIAKVAGLPPLELMEGFYYENSYHNPFSLLDRQYPLGDELEMSALRRIRKKLPIIIGKPPSQMKGKQWYLRDGNVLDIKELLKILPNCKAVSYLKVSGHCFGGSLQEIQYWKVLDNGYMIFVDLGRCKVGIVRGLPQSRYIMAGTKAEYEKALSQIRKILSI